MPRASPGEVDGHFERRCILLHRRRALLDRIGKAAGRDMGQDCRLDEDQLLDVAPFAQSLHIVDGHRRKTLLLQRERHKGMPFGQHQHGIEAGLFEASRIKQRQVEAGACLAFQHPTRTAYLLAGALEARRRQHIYISP
jgi:hypothetical protein